MYFYLAVKAVKTVSIWNIERLLKSLLRVLQSETLLMQRVMATFPYKRSANVNFKKIMPNQIFIVCQSTGGSSAANSYA